eukprot:2328323-Heterocapsa_arctica.AAC.1
MGRTTWAASCTQLRETNEEILAIQRAKAASRLFQHTMLLPPTTGSQGKQPTPASRALESTCSMIILVS